MKCGFNQCNRIYHSSCLSNSSLATAQPSNVYYCPLHVCATCRLYKRSNDNIGISMLDYIYEQIFSLYNTANANVDEDILISSLNLMIHQGIDHTFFEDYSNVEISLPMDLKVRFCPALSPAYNRDREETNCALVLPVLFPFTIYVYSDTFRLVTHL